MSEGDAPVPAPSGLGARITKARLERDMTQGQLAERLHVKQASVSMIESGELDPTDDLTQRIKAWIDSGAGPKKPAPRGPREHYETKKRSTIQR